MKIAVGMSGGVDSAVVAALLCAEGHEVVGVSMLTWKHSLCCAFEDVTQARLLCKRLGLKHYIIDLMDAFREEVVNPYIQQRLQGLTPNPCPGCNRDFKLGRMWSGLLQRMRQQTQAELLATGHYVRKAVDPLTRRLGLWRARDRQRDQSYMLWSLSQEQLAYCHFPLGEYRKPQIRKLALGLGLGELASKPDSQDLCFLTPDHKQFWQREAGSALQPGEIVDCDSGQVLGQHRGLPFYTLGQRRGLQLTDGQRRYVQGVSVAENQLWVSTSPPAAVLELPLEQVNYVSIGPQEAGPETECLVQVRYHGEFYPASWLPDTHTSSRGTVHFKGGLPPVASGQSVVLYDAQGRILAGGCSSACFSDNVRF